MNIKTYVDRDTMSRAAARHAAQALRHAIDSRGGVRIIVATGASQLGFLDALTRASGIDWARVELFHLDEYIGWRSTIRDLRKKPILLDASSPNRI